MSHHPEVIQSHAAHLSGIYHRLGVLCAVLAPDADAGPELLPLGDAFLMDALEIAASRLPEVTKP